MALKEALLSSRREKGLQIRAGNAGKSTESVGKRSAAAAGT